MGTYNNRRAWSKMRNINLKVGFILSGLFVLFAFEWTTSPKEHIISDGITWEENEVFISPPTVQHQEKLPPPEKIIEPKKNEIIPEEYIIKESLKEEFVEEDVHFLQEDLFSQEDYINPSPPTEQAPIVSPITENDGDEIHDIVAQMPVFGDCSEIENEAERYACSNKSIMRFIGQNIKFTEHAKDINLTGKVIAKFVIDKNGEVIDIEILRGLGAGLDEEVIRVLELMPKWKPGKQNYRPVKVKMIVPVKFELN